MSQGEEDVIIEMLESALREGKDLSSHIEGTTFLHYFAFSGMFFGKVDELMREFPPVISDVSVCDSKGRTPFHLAALSCSYLRTERLLDFGLPFDKSDDRGLSPLRVCLDLSPRELLKDRGPNFIEMMMSSGLRLDQPDLEYMKGVLHKHFGGVPNDHWAKLVSGIEFGLLTSKTGCVARKPAPQDAKSL